VLIAAVCPHCDSRYSLQPDLLGKAMRCPNPDCREVFVVQADATQVAPASPPPPPPAPAVPAAHAPAGGAVGDFVPVFEAEAAGPPPRVELPYERVERDDLPAVPVLEGEAAGPARPVPVAPVVLDAEVLRRNRNAAPVPAKPARPAPAAAPVGPREVVWSDAAPAPGPKEVAWTPDDAPAPAKAATAVASPDAELDELLLRRRRGRNYWAYALVGILVGIAGLGLAIGGRLLYLQVTEERTLADEAMEEFKRQNYPKADELYTSIRDKFPTSENAPRYKFFGDLSGLHVIGGSVLVKDDPQAAIERFKAFVAEHGTDPLSAPDETGYGYDVFQAGAKMVDGVIDGAKDRLARYKADRTKLDQLAAAEAVAEAGRELAPQVEKYKVRDKDVKGLDEQRKKLDELAAECGRERLRLAVLAPYRDLPADPTDERIDAFDKELVRTGFAADAEARGIIEAAKARLRGLVRYVPDVHPPAVAPADAAPGVLFVATPAGRVEPPPVPPAADAVPETFLAVARGVLYAFDAENGGLLWAARAERSATDLPARVSLNDGGTDLYLVPTEAGGVPGLVARAVRTGQPVWYQPLEAPVAGRPAVAGRRVLVPLRDEAGTVVEIEARTGNRLGFIQLRQRVGAGAAVGPTGLVYVAAEARRVFVLDADPHDADGNREPLRCVQVLATNHPDLSVRVPPVLAGPPVGPGNRFLVLAQADGTQTTGVRAFPLPPASADRPPDAGPPEVAVAAAATVPLPGHVWFPMAEVGERVAVVTDAGAFALLGTNQPGNRDPGLYPVPSTPLPADPKTPLPGQVVAADEDSFWVLARGKLQRLRLGFNPQSGLSVAASGPPLPGGLPLQSPQLSLRRDTAFAVVQSEGSDGVRAIAFDPRDGRLKWDRKLGAIPPVPPLLAGSLLADEDGGVYRLPPTAAPGMMGNEGAKPAEKAWTLAPPLAAAAGPARVVASADGKTVWVLVPDRGEKDAPTLRVRQIADGAMKGETVVALPERPAGPAVAAGTGVVLPLADGQLYRFDPGAAKLTVGPQWRAETAGPEAVCYLSPSGPDEFLATDGGRGLSRYRWPSAAGEWKRLAGPWELRDRVLFAPLAVRLGETGLRVFAADAGGVSMFDGDRGGDAEQRWRGGEGAVPSGKPGVGFVATTGADGRPLVTYAVDGKHLIAVSPTAKDAVWVARRPSQDDLLGWVADGPRLVVTDQAGNVAVYDAARGQKLGPPIRPDGELLPRAHAVPFGKDRLILPAADGSVVFLPYAGANP
jgi:outer membrane protein assembly factor BamB